MRVVIDKFRKGEECIQICCICCLYFKTTRDKVEFEPER